MYNSVAVMVARGQDLSGRMASSRVVQGAIRCAKLSANSRKLDSYAFQGWRSLSIRLYSSSQKPKFSTSIPEFENEPGINSHGDLYKFSLENPDVFWGRLARSRLSWYRDFDKVQDCDLSKGKIAWFLNGQLNVSVNCIDRHVESHPDRTALIWERDEPGTQEYVSYKQLLEMTNQLANMLKSHGVAQGDRVVIYMPVSPIAVATMLACARIGALHSVVFAGFSSDALASRIQDADAQTVITTDQGIRGGKLIELKKTVDGAVAKCPGIKRVFVAQRTGAEVPMGKLDFSLEKEMSKQSAVCEPAVLNSEDLLFLLYTSGSTGKPKGVAHSQAGYLLYTALTHKFVFDYNEGDIFGCVADIGWITGHSYVVYGPLCNGATTVLFESVPTYPDPVGEPLNHEAWEWYHQVVGEGRCPISDTWWQTETGGICISPRPSEPGAEILPGMPMRPFFGIEPALLNEQGKEIEAGDAYGALCMKRAWPGLARTVYGDHQRFMDTYFNIHPGYFFSGDAAHKNPAGYYQITGYYCTGDGVHRLEQGYLRITGRMDDVINVSGHRLGTAEIEDAMDEHPAVSETAVVGFPHQIKGEGVYAYVTLKEGISEPESNIIEELKALVKQQIASYAVPEMVQVAPGLPKTRSGKIMRRILRNVAANKPDELGDISTLADPTVVAAIVKNHEDLVNKTEARQ